MCTSKVLASFVKWFQYVEKKKKKNQEVTWVSLLVTISFHRQTLNLSLMQDVENLICFTKSFITVR